MQIRNKTNHGLAEVDEALAQRLVESGVWEPADAPRPAVRRTRRKPAQKAETTE